VHGRHGLLGLAADLFQPPLQGRHAIVHLLRHAAAARPPLLAGRLGRGGLRRARVTVHAAALHPVLALIAHARLLRPGYHSLRSRARRRRRPARRAGRCSARRAPGPAAACTRRLPLRPAPGSPWAPAEGPREARPGGTRSSPGTPAAVPISVRRAAAFLAVV